jgi:hypothetical protein
MLNLAIFSYFCEKSAIAAIILENVAANKHSPLFMHKYIINRVLISSEFSYRMGKLPLSYKVHNTKY